MFTIILNTKSDTHINFIQGLQVLFDALPCLFLIVVVIGGILIGAFTSTEASAIAVVYSLLLSFLYREIKIRELPAIFLSTVKMTAIVIFMIGMSSIMSWVMAFTKVPEIIASMLFYLTDSRIIIFMIMNLFLLMIGTFMDPTPAVLIFTPIFYQLPKS